MEITKNFFLLLILFIPILATLVNYRIRRMEFIRMIANLTLSFLGFANSLLLLIYYKNGTKTSLTLVDIMPEFSLKFAAEPIGLIFACVASFLWFITNIYTISYFKNDERRTIQNYYIFLSLTMGACFGLAFAANLFTFFIFYELITLFTYPLVILKGDEKSKKAGLVYLIYLFGTSLLFFLPAIIITYSLSGNLDFSSGVKILPLGITSPFTYITLLILFTFGLSKSALMPLHKWLPDAMVAPSPVSALLHAVCVVKAGIFGFLKIGYYVFGLENISEFIGIYTSHSYNILTILASISIILSSIFALLQKEIKKMLAYSTISNLSICLIALSLFTPKALLAAIFHMVSHAIGKITLFFAAGSLEKNMETNNYAEAKGFAYILPLEFTAIILGTIAMCGFGIFGPTSKMLILEEASRGTIIKYSLYFSTLTALVYLGRLLFTGLYYKNHKAKTTLNFPSISLALACSCILIIFTAPIFHFFTRIIREIVIVGGY